MAGGVQWRRAGRIAARYSRSPRTRKAVAAPVLEPLETRQLLSYYTGFSSVRNILPPSGIYNLQISGPGILKTSAVPGGSVDLKVLGTSTASTLTVTQVRPRFHAPNQLLSIRNLAIRSGQIGSIIA